MKRNRLIRSTSQASLFSNNSAHTNKRGHLFALSLLTFAGIFITTIVLATSRPANINNTESQVISLPSLPAEMQNFSNSTSILKHDNSTLPANHELTDTAFHIDPVQPNTVATIAVQDDTLKNVTSIEVKSPILSWREITVKSGDNLSLIFPRVGLSARDVYDVAQLGKDIKPLLNLKPGQKLRFGFMDGQNSTTFEKLQLEISLIETLEVIATEQGFKTNRVTRDIEKRQMHASGVIQNSLFEAGIKAGLSDKTVMELAYIFGWDVDFSLDLRIGDNFKLVFEEDYLNGDKIADGDILAAEFTNQGKTFRAVRYTDDTGLSRFYSPEGNSMRKSFIRSPVHFSRISSKFNPNRKHPVLKTKRPHRGVDYAAATGTPIMAAGDGKIAFLGRKGGYGRTIILSHGGKYTTLYGHMSRYKKGLRTGKQVKQGDTIGYVGKSGLATGPHLHYEFRVNGVHRNPLTVALPKAQPLPKKYQADFKQKSQPLLAYLDRFDHTTALAFND
ncbi:MAG: peptidoglycan DD-metalloendopeptidase family protein [Gammaproteobacteria bacterium]|nr:peptidoglycan DD-metalloendopeptidase family protein [Gammaproteobacteria bacterium]MDH5591225.1 peptidoglycan DD-metalloendopeptidase family protein [Gammaproteobacteria bacterium]